MRAHYKPERGARPSCHPKSQASKANRAPAVITERCCHPSQYLGKQNLEQAQTPHHSPKPLPTKPTSPHKSPSPCEEPAHPPLYPTHTHKHTPCCLYQRLRSQPTTQLQLQRRPGPHTAGHPSCTDRGPGRRTLHAPAAAAAAHASAAARCAGGALLLLLLPWLLS